MSRAGEAPYGYESVYSGVEDVAKRLKYNSEVLRREHPDIKPAEIGLQSFEQVPALIKKCEVAGRKKSVEEMFTEVLDCKAIRVEECEKRAEELLSRLELLHSEIKAGHTSLGELGMTETDLNGKQSALYTRLAGVYEDLLGVYPSAYDHMHEPAWLSDRAANLYTEGKSYTSEVKARLAELKTQAYARRVDYLLRVLNMGLEYPESARTASQARKFMTEGGLKLKEFGFSEAKLKKLIRKDPRLPEAEQSPEE